MPLRTPAQKSPARREPGCVRLLLYLLHTVCAGQIIYQELVALFLDLSAQQTYEGGARLPEYIRPSLNDFDAHPE